MSVVDVVDLEAHRKELTGYCYRMLGSAPDAEDAVQEVMVRAWRRGDGFEGRSSARTWLYRIATNVCLDARRSASRRIAPMQAGPASEPREELLGPLEDRGRWVGPVPSASLADDPAEVVAMRDTVRLAFVAALQLLPPRQRAALVLCDVLRWPAAEVAGLLGVSTAAVSSSLQRARASMPAAPAPDSASTVVADDLLDRYVDAFERYDVDALAGLLAADAVQSMPPFAMWLRGAANIARWMVQPGPLACRGSRLVPTSANGGPAFAQYRPDQNGGYTAWSLQVIEAGDGRITELHSFLDVGTVFPTFGLPLSLAR